MPPPLSLVSTAGREWLLHPERALSPTRRLVRLPAHPAALVLETVTHPTPAAAALALSDLSACQRAHRAAPAHVLHVHAVFAPSPTVVLVLSDHHPASLSRPAPPDALRLFAAVAAAVHAVCHALDQPAHGNLSLAHVLLPARRAPVLAGFGYARANRLANRNRPLSARDDVRALAAMLYELVYGAPWRPPRRALPVRPDVPPAVARLLEAVLLVPMHDVPDLTVFRYDLAAARGLVPHCSAALKPLETDRRKETLLGADLDSVRGLEPHARPDARQGERVLPVAPADARTHAPHPQEPLPELGDAELQQVVMRLAHADPEPFRQEDVDLVLAACAASPEMPERLFKMLFALKISKNPIVAFKAAMLIHQLVAEGPAHLTAVAITKDGFLSWTESEWTRERIPSKPGKPHLLAYCFAAGEISWYVAIVRKRIFLHANFAQALSTRWIPRLDGVAAFSGKRREAVRATLEIVEKCNGLLRKCVTAKDPSASLKQSAVPLLVMEISKAYLTICYVYATADERDKAELNAEMAIAHRSTKTALESVHSNEALLAMCPPSALLDLGDEPATNLSVQEIVSAMRKKKKKKKKQKKKKKVPSVEEDSLTEVHAGEATPDLGEDDEVANGRRSSNEEERQEDIPIVDGIAEKQKKSKKAKKRKEAKQNGKTVTEIRLASPATEIVSDARTSERLPPYSESRPAVPVHGMAKLSLSVRKGVAKSFHSADMQPVAGPAIPVRSTLPASRGRSSSAGDVSQGGERRMSRHHHPENGDVLTDSDSESPVRQRPPTGKSRLRETGRHRPVTNTGSDPELSRSPRRSISKPKNRRGRRPSVDSESESETSSSNNDDSTEEEEEEARKILPKKSKGKETRPRKSTHKKPTDEKHIPFDKEPPKRKKTAKAKESASQKVDSDHIGGSKEALAAAASGKKTPSINPRFEVAPYEVTFGKQVGSGGFGIVFKAKFRGETVAVKKIHAHALSNASSIAEFQSEVAVLCTLQHPNILRFVGACTMPPNLMIITEFMSRGTLFDVLHQSQMRVPWSMRKKFAMDTCRGMRYLHDSKLLHRDLKSSNLMLDKDFNCKVGDFGLTRLSRGAAAAQMTGQCGTFQYMAVEVLTSKPYSEKADVFSFGILLWEMVARKLPYFGMQPMQVGMAVVQQGMRPPIPPKCPAPLVKLMKACWDSDPNVRPSFAQLVQALEAMPE